MVRPLRQFVREKLPTPVGKGALQNGGDSEVEIEQCRTP
jgi:hypothetical protein